MTSNASGYSNPNLALDLDLTFYLISQRTGPESDQHSAMAAKDLHVPREAPVGGSRMRTQRGSIFELPPCGIRPMPIGSSMMSFAYEPHPEDMPKPVKKITYENTYRMEPPVKFQTGQVEQIIQEVLNNNLNGKTYHPFQAPSMSKALSLDIKTKVKKLNFQRYKIVAVVTIGEKKDQGLRVGSRCLWDADRDSYAEACFENAHIYGIGAVYGIYFE